MEEKKISLLEKIKEFRDSDDRLAIVCRGSTSFTLTRHGEPRSEISRANVDSDFEILVCDILAVLAAFALIGSVVSFIRRLFRF